MSPAEVFCYLLTYFPSAVSTPEQGTMLYSQIAAAQIKSTIEDITKIKEEGKEELIHTFLSSFESVSKKMLPKLQQLG